ncbi:MAG TPA: DMT family transporter [Drouetiella sp.]
MEILDLLLAASAGSLATLQAGINSQLRLLAGPWWTVCISLAVSVSVTLLVLLVVRAPLPEKALFSGAPWWIWTGGLCGIVFVLAGAVLAPKLGASSYTSAIIAGQILCSVLLDQFGILGFPKHSINVQRLLGIILLAAGVFLIRRF